MYFEDEDNCTVTEMLHDVEQKNVERLKQDYIKDEFGSAFLPQGERKQVGGSHYQLPIQPIDYIVQNDIPYREGNAIKYITRHRSKNGKQDIEKAIHYLEMILEDYND